MEGEERTKGRNGCSIKEWRRLSHSEVLKAGRPCNLLVELGEDMLLCCCQKKNSRYSSLCQHSQGKQHYMPLHDHQQTCPEQQLSQLHSSELLWEQTILISYSDIHQESTMMCFQFSFQKKPFLNSSAHAKKPVRTRNCRYTPRSDNH